MTSKWRMRVRFVQENKEVERIYLKISELSLFLIVQASICNILVLRNYNEFSKFHLSHYLVMFLNNMKMKSHFYTTL